MWWNTWNVEFSLLQHENFRVVRHKQTHICILYTFTIIKCVQTWKVGIFRHDRTFCVAIVFFLFDCRFVPLSLSLCLIRFSIAWTHTHLISNRASHVGKTGQPLKCQPIQILCSVVVDVVVVVAVVRHNTSTQTCTQKKHTLNTHSVWFSILFWTKQHTLCVGNYYYIHTYIYIYFYD